MRSKHSLKRFASVISMATQSSRERHALEQSRLGLKVRNSDHKFANGILDMANQLNSVEDMVVFERTLQELDILKAKSAADRNSIVAAQKSYEKLAITIEQLKSSPDSYFTMNRGNKEYTGDPRCIVKSNSLDHIGSNITRMQNRKQFSSESESEIWDARIHMARKTGDMFKTLHENLADEFLRKQQNREE